MGMRKAVSGARRRRMSFGWKTVRRLPRLSIFLFSMMGFRKRSEAFYSTKRKQLLGLLDADQKRMASVSCCIWCARLPA